MRKFPAGILHAAVAVSEHATEDADFRIALHDREAGGDATWFDEGVAVQQEEIFRGGWKGHLLTEYEIIPSGEAEIDPQRTELEPGGVPSVLCNGFREFRHRVISRGIIQKNNTHIRIPCRLGGKCSEAIDGNVRCPEIQYDNGKGG